MKRSYRAKKERKSRFYKISFAVALLICLVATLGYLRSRLWIVDLSYEYNQLRKDLREAKQENSRLRVEVQRLKSPSRVHRIARQKLGLLPREEAEPLVNVIPEQPVGDADMEIHGHFKCEECSAVYDIDVEADKIEIKSLDNFQINEHHLYFKGICDKCLEKKSK